MHKKKQQIIAGLVLGALVIGGGSFFAGMKYAGGSRGGFAAGGQFAGRAGGMAGGRGMNGGIVAGQVLSLDATSMTIKLRDGSSKIVFFSDATPVMKSAAGKTSDVQAGEQVLITGTPNSDGSVSAKTISINPASTTPMMGGGMMGR